MAGAGGHESDAPFETQAVAAASGVIDVHVAESTAQRVVLRVSGELDMVTAPVLTEHVREQFSRDPGPGRARTLVFDLTRVSFLGSAGLAVLAHAQATAVDRGDAVQVVASARAVLRPLEVTGLDKVLDIRPELPAGHESGSA
ncbi:MAG TPA: STAS domain-containing protein [Pseudonocardiaceae bacterium]|nr:STAS domain-containing protein [Pseudonocardiaceae bacterium]